MSDVQVKEIRASVEAGKQVMHKAGSDYPTLARRLSLQRKTRGGVGGCIHIVIELSVSGIILCLCALGVHH